MSRAGMYVASIISVTLIGLGIWQFMPPSEEAADAGDETTATETASFQPPAAGPVTVTAAEVFRGELVKRITANGVAEAEKLLHVASEVGGKIERIVVVEGQWVEAGDLLVELDDTELIMDRDRAEEMYNNRIMLFASNQIDIDLPSTASGTASRSADGENALQFLRRYINEEAYRTMLRQPDLEERLSELTREDLFLALAELTNQRVALEQVELDLARTRIVAPFAGQVAGLEATSGPNSKSWPVVGQRINAGTDLMMLVDPNPIRVRVEVIESEISYVRSGRRAEVSFQAFPGEVFYGNVEAIDAVVDATRKTLSVIVRLSNSDPAPEAGHVRPGLVGFRDPRRSAAGSARGGVVARQPPARFRRSRRPRPVGVRHHRPRERAVDRGPWRQHSRGRRRRYRRALHARPRHTGQHRRGRRDRER